MLPEKVNVMSSQEATDIIKGYESLPKRVENTMKTVRDLIAYYSRFDLDTLISDIPIEEKSNDPEYQSKK